MFSTWDWRYVTLGKYCPRAKVKRLPNVTSCYIATRNWVHARASTRFLLHYLAFGTRNSGRSYRHQGNDVTKVTSGLPDWCDIESLSSSGERYSLTAGSEALPWAEWRYLGWNARKIVCHLQDENLQQVLWLQIYTEVDMLVRFVSWNFARLFSPLVFSSTHATKANSSHVQLTTSS